MVFSSCMHAYNVYGPTYSILEEDAIAFMQKKASRFDFDSKENKDKIIKKISKRALRPEGIRLPSCHSTKSITISLEQVVNEDIILPCGKVLARKGQKYNPLKILPRSNKGLVFIDGTNKNHIKMAKSLIDDNDSLKIVLVNGSVKDVSETLDIDIYFDQGGKIIDKFDVSCVPSILKRDNNNLLLSEVLL